MEDIVICMIFVNNKYNIMEFDNDIISHMTSHLIDLTWFGWFGSIIYAKIDLSLIIYYLTYLIVML